jgi:hypothetical protein
VQHAICFFHGSPFRPRLSCLCTDIVMYVSERL